MGRGEGVAQGDWGSWSGAVGAADAVSVLGVACTVTSMVTPPQHTPGRHTSYTDKRGHTRHTSNASLSRRLMHRRARPSRVGTLVVGGERDRERRGQSPRRLQARSTWISHASLGRWLILYQLRPIGDCFKCKVRGIHPRRRTCFVSTNGDEPAARVFIAAAGAGHGRGRAA